MARHDKTLEETVGLPMRPFLYTLDQIATLIQIPEDRLKRDYVHFEDRSVGFREDGRLLARNIAPEGQPPEWRIMDRELARWMTKKGFRVYLRGWATH